MNATKMLRLRPVNSPGPDGYSLRDNEQGRRIGVVYERDRAVQIVQAVNNFGGMLEALREIARMRFNDKKLECSVVAEEAIAKAGED